MATKLAKDDKGLLEELGDPLEVYLGLREFRRNARFLSSKRARLVKQYPNEWVAIHEEKVKAHAGTLTSLLEEVDKQGLRGRHVAIGFLGTTEPTLIL